MRIVFFGSPAAALPAFEKLLETGHRIELAVTQPDRPSGRGRTPAAPPVKEFALKRGISVLQPARIRQDESAYEAIKRIGPEVNIVVAYGQIIPAAIIYLPKFRSLNLHFSLLPKYRGAAPVQRAILNGEEKTGVTIFELSEKMDEGDVLSSEEVRIYPEENSWQLEARLAKIGADLLIRTLERIEDIPRVPQDHAQASLAPRLKKEEGRIDWTKEAIFVDRMVRAFAPWPGAFTFFKGRRLIIHAGKRLADQRSDQPPGRITGIKKEGIAVSCGAGTVFLVERLQRADKKVMEAAVFLRGTKISPGDSFD
jgi:methionyl-tRNA formyltransferase